MTERGLLGAVYDCTIAYPDTKPSTEMAVLRGELPTQVGVYKHLHLHHSVN